MSRAEIRRCRRISHSFYLINLIILIEVSWILGFPTKPTFWKKKLDCWISKKPTFFFRKLDSWINQETNMEVGLLDFREKPTFLGFLDFQLLDSWILGFPTFKIKSWIFGFCRKTNKPTLKLDCWINQETNMGVGLLDFRKKPIFLGFLDSWIFRRWILGFLDFTKPTNQETKKPTSSGKYTFKLSSFYSDF